jgi:hypothetical protein
MVDVCVVLGMLDAFSFSVRFWKVIILLVLYCKCRAVHGLGAREKKYLKKE